MAEWLKAAVLKTVVGASLPGVRIPLPPPVRIFKLLEAAEGSEVANLYSFLGENEMQFEPICFKNVVISLLYPQTGQDYRLDLIRSSRGESG